MLGDNIKYKIEVIYNSKVYTNKLGSKLLHLYYLIA